MKKLLDAIRQLHGCNDLDAFADRVVRSVGTVVSCDFVCYTEVNVARRRALHQTDDEDSGRELARFASFYDRFVHQHPLVVLALREPETVAKFSDFLTLRELRNLALYQEFLRHIDAMRQIGVCLSATPELAVGVALNRSGRDFNERDRRRLSLLRPHLVEAYRAATLRTDLTKQVGGRDLALRALRAGVLTVDAIGRIRDESAAARAALLAAFPGDAGRGDLLPTLLRDQLAASLRERDRIDRPRAFCPEITYQGPTGTLRLRVLDGMDSDRTTMLVRYDEASNPVERLHRDGLTRREAETLYRLTLGESNKEIARALGIRPGTARIHVERILGKLDVPTRAAAAAAAARWLSGDA
jgi:DNA-binding CsgD family transcriptional regulator